MTKIWLVIGNTGEYDSYTEWAAVVCTSKRTADTVAARLDAVVTAGPEHATYADQESNEKIAQRLRDAGDPHAVCRDRDTSYQVEGPFDLIHSVKEL